MKLAFEATEHPDSGRAHRRRQVIIEFEVDYRDGEPRPDGALTIRIYNKAGWMQSMINQSERTGNPAHIIRKIFTIRGSDWAKLRDMLNGGAAGLPPYGGKK